MVVSYEKHGEVRYAKVLLSIDEILFAEDIETGDKLRLPASEVKPAEEEQPTQLVEVSTDEIGKFCRYEITWEELTHGSPTNSSIDCSEPYEIKLTDFTAAMDRIKNEDIPEQQAFIEWYAPLCEAFKQGMTLITPEDPEESRTGIEALPTRKSVLEHLLRGRLYGLFANSVIPFSEIHKLVCGRINDLLADEDKPPLERTYSKHDREVFLEYWDDDDKLRECDDRMTLELYRRFADELASQCNIHGLHAKGFGCFGGNRAYKCNWEDAQLCLDTAYIITGEAQYAAGLGYIYYHGKTSDGKPDYDRAFKYLSISAASGVQISRCLLSDMFLSGHTVIKNRRITSNILLGLYEKQIRKIFRGKFDNRFPETTLRMGNLLMLSEIDRDNSVNAAFVFYLYARFALRMRRQYYFYDDEKLAETIDSAINDTLATGMVVPRFPETEVQIGNILDVYFAEKYRFLAKIRKLENGDIRLTFRLAPNSDGIKNIFVCVSDAAYCGFMNKLTVTLKGGEIAGPFDISKEIEFDDISRRTFLLDKVPVMKLIGGRIIFRKPAEAMRKHKIMLVKLENNGGTKEYLADGFDDAKIGMEATIEKNMHRKKGEVISIFDRYEDELHFPIDSYDSITECDYPLPF